VTYKTHEEAKAALEKLKGEEGYIRDRKFRVQFTSESGAKRKRYSTGNDSAAQFQNRALRVKNLAGSVTEVDLFNRFKAYGYILNLDVWNNEGYDFLLHACCDLLFNRRFVNPYMRVLGSVSLI